MATTVATAKAGGGIWGDPTNTTMMNLPMQTTSNFGDVLNTAMGTAKGLQGLIAQNDANKLANLNAQLAQGKVQLMNQTLPNQIQDLNTKYTTDTHYYPLLQAASLAAKNASIKRISAQTGLSNLQASLVSQKIKNLQNSTDPTYPGRVLDQLYNATQGLQNTDPAKLYNQNLINAYLGHGMPPTALTATGATTKKKGAQATQGIPGMPPLQSTTTVGANGIQTNPLGGSGRSTFHQGYVDTPNGPITMESPTTNAASRNQMRVEAHTEMNKIYPIVMNGNAPYQGRLGFLKLMYDGHLANMTPTTPFESSEKQAAMQRLSNYELAKMFIPELASINAKQAGNTTIGKELNSEYQNSMFRFLPDETIEKYSVPAQAIRNAAMRYPGIQGNAIAGALNQERTGYQSPSPTPPVWAQGQTQDTGGYVGPNGYIPPHPPIQSAPTQMQGGYVDQNGYVAPHVVQSTAQASSPQSTVSISDIQNAARAELARRLGGKK